MAFPCQNNITDEETITSAWDVTGNGIRELSRGDNLLILEDEYRKMEKEENWAFQGGETVPIKAQRHERVCHSQGLAALGAWSTEIEYMQRTT